MSISLPLITLGAVEESPAWTASPELEAAATLLRLLGDPRRLELIRLLGSAERCVCEFQELLGWPQNLISHHLGVLRRAGIVQARRDAQWVYYSLVPHALDHARELLGSILEVDGLPPDARYGAAPRRCTP